MNIINLYEKYFDEETKKIFEKFSNYNVYLVGGLVRDMILDKKSKDIDITFEGNALELAPKIDCEILSTHDDFGTVKIQIGNKKLDLASTRTETYPQQGHLPVVNKTGCSLKDDILRRDFTVNSLAMSLNKNNFGEVFDFVNGLEDLKNKKIKVLHKNSFSDDPSRILRGLKYASRLNFTLDTQTLNLQEEYLKNINYDMSYSRILNEFFRIEWNKNIFKTFLEQGIYKIINPDLNLPVTDSSTDLDSVLGYDFWSEPKNPFIYLALLLPDSRFELSKKERQIIETVRIFDYKFNSDLEIYKTFSKHPTEVAEILSILGNKFAKKYIKELKKIKISITGKDLLELGFEPSKEIQKIFDFVLCEKLKNPKLSKNDELNLIKTTFQDAD